MSIHGDPRLLVAHWADEATRAENDPETLQARAHRSEDRLAAARRAGSGNSRSARIFARLMAWAVPRRR